MDFFFEALSFRSVSNHYPIPISRAERESSLPKTHPLQGVAQLLRAGPCSEDQLAIDGDRRRGAQAQHHGVIDRFDDIDRLSLDTFIVHLLDGFLHHVLRALASAAPGRKKNSILTVKSSH